MYIAQVEKFYLHDPDVNGAWITMPYGEDYLLYTDDEGLIGLGQGINKE